MITFKHRGTFKRTEKFLQNASKIEIKNILDKYGKLGVDALSAATPVDSGTTAASWSYRVSQNSSGYTVEWLNSNINQGVPIAIILQYGHGTGTGGYVAGIDYINPALKHLFDQLADEAWKEVTRA